MFTPKSTTKDGFPDAVRHKPFSHFAFIGLLLDRVLAVLGSRVVTSQRGSPFRHRSGINFDDLQWEKRTAARRRSVRAGQAHNLCSPMSCSAGCRAPKTIAAAAHPAVAHRTDPATCRPLSGCDELGSRQFRMPTWSAHIAGGHRPGDHGQYWPRRIPVSSAAIRRRFSRASQFINDAQRRLWTVSEELTA